MTWLRRLLRFLARSEIEAEVMVAVARERAQCAVATALHRNADYLEGVRFGSEQAFKAMEGVVRERMAGADDAPTEEDLCLARRRVVH